jgi:hypothetical protein
MGSLIKMMIISILLLIPIIILVSIMSTQKELVTSFVQVSPKSVEMVPFWNVRSIDTVKYSRDVAKEKINDSSYDQVIELQVKNIAQTGATHVSIGTPYDAEFIPFLEKWVSAARRNRLHVWYRGNLSGWEKWFGYARIDRESHKKGIEQFILEHPDLFEDGDILTTCTECENGGPGDPRQNGDVEGHRNFLIEEYQISQNAFKKIGKKVATNYFSMNGDVAKLIMDKETTKALDGIVVIDHYVKTKEKLNKDITELAEKSGGKIVLGEWGAPIPDIHGKMTEAQQATWLADAFELLANNPNLVGINYWTNMGSSTELWKEDSSEKKAVEVIKLYYTKKIEKN